MFFPFGLRKAVGTITMTGPGRALNGAGQRNHKRFIHGGEREETRFVFFYGLRTLLAAPTGYTIQ